MGTFDRRRFGGQPPAGRLTGLGTLSGTALAKANAAAALTGLGHLVGSGDLVALVSAALTGQGAGSATAHATARAAAALTGAGALAADGSAGGGGFNISDFTALGTLEALWVPRDAGSLTLSGSNLVTIADQTANGHDLDGFGNIKPQGGTRTLNGIPVLDFPATLADANDGAGMRATGQTTAAVDTGTWFAVFERDDSPYENDYARLLSLGYDPVSGGSDYNHANTIAPLLRLGGNAFWGTYYNGSGRTGIGPLNAPIQFIIVTRRNGDVIDQWVNNSQSGGIPASVSGMGTTAFGITAIGVGYNLDADTLGRANSPLVGGLGDLGWYSSALSDGHVSDLFDLLNGVYAVY